MNSEKTLATKVAIKYLDSNGDGIVSSEEEEGTMEQAVTAATIAAAGLGLMAINESSKKHDVGTSHVKVSPKEMSKLKPITNEKGNLTHYENDDGKKVADKDGWKLDSSGKKVHRGIVTTSAVGAVKMADKVKTNLFSPTTRSDESIEKSTDQQNPPSNDTVQQDSKDRSHNELLNLDKKSISNNTESSNDIKEKIDKVEKIPNEDVGRSKVSHMIDNELKTAEKGSDKEKALRQAKTSLKGGG